MRSKDYYKILELDATATTADIKKSYRRLAMKYHPDKNFDNKLSEIRFTDVHEAYNILSDEQKRQHYNHRVFDEKHGLKRTQTTDLPDAKVILEKCKHLRKKISFLDPHRLNREILSFKIEQILSVHNINILRTDNDQQTNRLVVEEILRMATLLDFDQVEEVCSKLKTIAETDIELQKKIYDFLKRQKINDYWNKYHYIAALLAAVIMTFLIYQLST